MGSSKNTITRSGIIKDTGVPFDSSLNFEAHMSEQNNKSNPMMEIIRRTFEYLYDQCYYSVFKSLARPHIEYANQNIIALQRRATK